MAPTRLINTRTLELEEPKETSIRYAILSHRWVDEVTFQEWNHRGGRKEITERRGYVKIRAFCHLAYNDGFDYAWVDTNCIDKTNSSELSEAINSMFSWYRDAARCYVYLHDLKHDPVTGLLPMLDTARCEWFTRGWTLQELLAPQNMWFYSRNWTCIGSKSELSDVLSTLTGIEDMYLCDTQQIYRASVAKRISWASGRQTGKAEDIAYSLLGIFDINMPLLYGEGAIKAFRRLQEEIIKVSTDQTIFAWEWPLDWKPEALDWVTFFAPSPLAFKNSGHFVSAKETSTEDEEFILSATYSMENVGLSIKLPVLDSFSDSPYSLAGLRCTNPEDDETPTQPPRLLGIPIYKSGIVCARVAFPPTPIPLSAFRARDITSIYGYRHGNLSSVGFDRLSLTTSLRRSDLSSQLYFMCFSVDKETPGFLLGDFEATPGSHVYPELALFTVRPVQNMNIAAGIVRVRKSSASLESAAFYLYLGVRSRKGTLSYYFNVKSARSSTTAKEPNLNGWTQQLGGVNYDASAYNDGSPATRNIREASECSHATVHLGMPVGSYGSIFIPVYISIKDKYRSSRRSLPRSLLVEAGARFGTES